MQDAVFTTFTKPNFKADFFTNEESYISTEFTTFHESNSISHTSPDLCAVIDSYCCAKRVSDRGTLSEAHGSTVA